MLCLGAWELAIEHQLLGARLLPSAPNAMAVQQEAGQSCGGGIVGSLQGALQGKRALEPLLLSDRRQQARSNGPEGKPAIQGAFTEGLSEKAATRSCGRKLAPCRLLARACKAPRRVHQVRGSKGSKAQMPG